MTGSVLRSRPLTSAAMLAIFDDRAMLRHALAFERELARAQAAVGLIPDPVAKRIGRACEDIEIDPAELADEAAMAGTLAIPLVARLRAVLEDNFEAAASVHRGATSQDLADTVMMLQAREAADLIDTDLRRIVGKFSLVARAQADTPAAGRTLLQDALPIAFGLRVAQWLAGIEDARRRLEQSCGEGLRLQLGGAAGTRTGLDGKGGQIGASLADGLGLKASVAPWHARRGHVAAIAAALGIVAGALGKMARDIALLSQGSVGEAREPMIEGRGGSSAMPHKRNPTGSQVALSAAFRTPGLVSTVLAAMPQELERGIGGWQSEGPVMAELFLLAGGSAEAMALVADGLEIDREAIARNLSRADLGEDIGEARAIIEDLLAEYGAVD